MPSQISQVQCCIVGCGPAGAMLGLLLARQGLRVVVLEKHTDFLRDFRGDDIAAATVEILDELGLAEAFLALSPRRVRRVLAHTPGGQVVLAELDRVRTRFPFVAVVPQWDFLSLLVRAAGQYPGFTVRMGAEVTELIREDGVVRGVRYRSAEGTGEVRAPLTVAADGRWSALRAQSGLPVRETAPAIDMLLFRLPRDPAEPSDDDIHIHLGAGWAMARLDRGDYWQGSCVIPKGAAEEIRAAGLDQLRDTITRVMPPLAEHLAGLESWDQLHLLSVRTDRLRRWYAPGLLVIGDAAHAMSPIGGTGVNFAIYDAVVAANRLGPLLAGGRVSTRDVSTRDLAAVQRRRAWQVRLMQAIQARLTSGYLAAADHQPGGVRALAQAATPKLMNVPGFCALRSRVTALGFRREHVAGTPDRTGSLHRPDQRGDR